MTDNRVKRVLNAPIFAWTVMALALLTVVVAVFFPIRSDDVFMYLALGRRMFNGGIPATDPFLFSMPNYHWHVLHEWGSYFFYYAAYLVGGFSGVIALKALLIGLMVFVAGFPLIRKRSFLLIPLIILALYPGAERFEEKASLFSDLFTLLLIRVLLSQNISRKLWLIAVPILFLLWSNLHPGMPLGFVIFGLVLAVKIFQHDFVRAKLWSQSLALSVICCLANPLGLEGFLYPFEKVFSPDWQIFRKLFFEWRPTFTPGFSTSFEVITLVAVWIVVAVVLLMNRRKKPILEFIFFALMVYLGTDAIRFMMLASLGSLLIVSKFIAQIHFEAKYDRAGWLCAGILQLSLLLMICFNGYPTFNGTLFPGTGVNEDLLPVKAADFIEQANWPGNMFNETNWGSYFAWRWDGQRKVFYHGHIDDPTFLDRTYMDAYRSPEKFDKLMHDYNIQIFVTTPQKLIAENPRSIQNLIRHVDKDWKIAYFDPAAAVLFHLSK